jgi:hypothetical protein
MLTNIPLETDFHVDTAFRTLTDFILLFHNKDRRAVNRKQS